MAKTERGSFEDLPMAGKMAVGFLVLVLLSVAAYLLVFSSLYESIETAEAQHKKLQNELTLLKKEQKEYLELKKKIAARRVIDFKNRRALPENSEIATFLQDLNRLAEVNGLKIRLVEPKAEQEEALYTRIPVSLGLSGRYHQVAKFFHDISQLERAINMENVSLREPEEVGDEIVLTVEVMATTFKRKASVPSPAQPAATKKKDVS